MADDPSRTVLVTGSSSGFGRLTAETLARRGHTVFASMRAVDGRNRDIAADLRALADREGIALHVIALDVTDDASVRSAVDHVLTRAGRLDVVVNNAGIGGVGHVEAFTPEQVHRLFDVNVVGAHRVNRAVLPHMRDRGSGLLVHVTSTFGRLVVPSVGVYCATKFALEALAEAYRYELAAVGVDSVIVQPGAYPTGFADRILLAADADRAAGYGAAADLPHRLGAGFDEAFSGPTAPNPQDVADVILALIETPYGERPLRTVVDRFTAPAVEAINETAGRIQTEILRSMGLE